MLYSQPSSNVKTITGRELARLASTPVSAAFVAADIIRGMLVVTDFTTKQVIALTGASLGYVSYAARATPEQRALALAGLTPLRDVVEPTTDELTRVVRRAGLEPVWSALCATL